MVCSMVPVPVASHANKLRLVRSGRYLPSFGTYEARPLFRASIFPDPSLRRAHHRHRYIHVTVASYT